MKTWNKTFLEGLKGIFFSYGKCLTRKPDRRKKRHPLSVLTQGGLGLVETLMTTAVGAVLTYGVLRVSLVAVQTAQVASTVQAERDLHITIQRMLGNKDDCKWNLKPVRLSKTSDKEGRLVLETDQTKSRGWTKTQGNTDTSDDIIYLDIGDFKNGLIDIKSMELLKGGAGTAENPTTWHFAVFYTKPQLGEYKTVGGGECDPTAATPKKAGCYFTTCELEKPHGSNNDDCAVKKCQGLGEEIPFNCEDEEYLQGAKADGTKECQSLSCSAGQVPIFKSETTNGITTITKECITKLHFKPPTSDPTGAPEAKCGVGKFLKGIKSADGSPDCATPPP